MCSRQRTCQKKRSTWQTVWNTNFTWKGSSQFPEISQLFWHGICSALEYGQEIARIVIDGFKSMILHLDNQIVWDLIPSPIACLIVILWDRLDVRFPGSQPVYKLKRCGWNMLELGHVFFFGVQTGLNWVLAKPWLAVVKSSPRRSISCHWHPPTVRGSCYINPKNGIPIVIPMIRASKQGMVYWPTWSAGLAHQCIPGSMKGKK